MDKWIKNNNFNKILALAFGIMLWAVVHIDTAAVPQTTVLTESKIIENVKIETSGFDENKYELVSIDANSVRMVVRGKSSDIIYKFSDAYKVTVDMSQVRPGNNKLPLISSLPKGVQLESMSPEEVNVHVELRNTKSFPITLITKGEPAQGYQVGTPVIQPTGTAEVTLSTSELSKVAKVQGTIELDGEKSTFKEKRMKLFAYDNSGNEIKDAVIEPSSVSVEIPITLPFKKVPLEIGFTGQLPGSLVLSKVTPDQDTVVLYGNQDTLDALSSFEATINLSSIDTAGAAQLKLELVPPDGIEKIEPGTVNVSVSTSAIADRTLEDIPVTLQGVGNGFEAVITDPPNKTITLTLSGAPALLDQLDKKSINVIADVSGLNAGTHEVALQVSLPQFIALTHSSERLAVTVQLQPPATPGTSEPAATGNTATPEPTSEPVSGEGEVSEPQPTQTDKIPEGSTPDASGGTSESNGSVDGSGDDAHSGNIGSTGGT